MKKILTGACCLGLALLMISCGEKGTTTSSLSASSSFTDLFKGDWNKPGLYEKDGSEHTMPQPQAETGMVVNVTDYGATPDDPSFDNYSAFNQAIENANEGDVIYVPNGTYYFEKYGRPSSE